MHRSLISGLAACPRPRDAGDQQIGKPQAGPRDHASFPQVVREAVGSITQEFLQPTFLRNGIASRPHRAAWHFLGMSDNGARSGMTHGHVKMRRPTARETAAEGTVAMAGQVARFARPARMGLETA